MSDNKTPPEIKIDCGPDSFSCSHLRPSRRHPDSQERALLDVARDDGLAITVGSHQIRTGHFASHEITLPPDAARQLVEWLSGTTESAIRADERRKALRDAAKACCAECREYDMDDLKIVAPSHYRIHVDEADPENSCECDCPDSIHDMLAALDAKGESDAE